MSGKRRVSTTLYQSHHKQNDFEKKIKYTLKPDEKSLTYMVVYAITKTQTTQKTQKMVINQTITEHKVTLIHHRLKDTMAPYLFIGPPWGQIIYILTHSNIKNLYTGERGW